MKINWGTGIFIAFTLFMGFILFFVMKVQTQSKYDNDLVVEEYYKQELKFQHQIDQEQHATDLKHKTTITATDKGVEINFPENFDAHNITGKVSLYRPSDKRSDFDTAISISESHLLIPKKDLSDGRWDITIEWSYEGVDYRDKKALYLK
ncbi:FixH family protein [Flavobacterium kingsejongi]|uniref:Cytochrome C oxidase Cbb3 n=1 Tax=Flavobacterium kingsejongi TaxID=1678728 RepID=A0A2S1LQV4_9FLAO|nr:FixH family protein [Flavobacterium kingsejongi]AWG26109.1 cytochrome C oxidase Cbb3 [Flavobacterium kingsejongi]